MQETLVLEYNSTNCLGHHITKGGITYMRFNCGLMNSAQQYNGSSMNYLFWTKILEENHLTVHRQF